MAGAAGVGYRYGPIGPYGPTGWKSDNDREEFALKQLVKIPKTNNITHSNKNKKMSRNIIQNKNYH